MKIIRATEEGLIFRAKLNSEGIKVEDAEAKELAQWIAREMNTTVSGIYGDFKTTTFVFGRPLTKDEIDLTEICWA